MPEEDDDRTYEVRWVDGPDFGRSCTEFTSAAALERLRLVETSSVVYTREHFDETEVVEMDWSGESSSRMTVQEFRAAHATEPS